MLSDKEIDALREKHAEGRGAGWRFNFNGFARAIEAAVIDRCAQIAARHNTAHWKHDAPSAHVADMVAIDIAKDIRGKA